MEEKLTLIMIAGPDLGKCFQVLEQGAVIGRSRVCDICIADEELSRQHCRLFWALSSVRLEDLNSSNGTYLNDQMVNGISRPLVDGDTISIGATKLRVELKASEGAAPTPAEEMNPPPAPEPTKVVAAETPADSNQSDAATVQPELFKREEDAGDAPTQWQFKRLLFPLIAVVILVLGASVALTLDFTKSEELPRVRQVKAEAPKVEFEYERLLIDEQHLFRYSLKYDGIENRLHLSVDDLGEADRSFKKQVVLSDDAKKALAKLFSEANLEKIGLLFPERSSDGVSFGRRTLTVVQGTEVWTRVAENIAHQQFDSVCEKLEFFATNELNIWAAQYSIAELEQMGAEQLEIAQRYWEQRDLGDDKLWLAIVAYKKGLSAIDTLNPKPAYVKALTDGLQTAEALLSERYEDAHFQVEQAVTTQRYDVAVQQLQKIMRMIPDREDARNRQASEKLLTVEQRRNVKGGR